MPNQRLFYRDIIGQENVVARLKAFTDFFAETGGTPRHILLTGEDGIGKASLAIAVCNERDVGLMQADAATLEIQGDLTARLTNLRPIRFCSFPTFTGFETTLLRGSRRP